MATKEKKDPKETPLMKQYYAIKAKHPNALLLFRVGDFMKRSAKMQLRPRKYSALCLLSEEMVLRQASN